MTSTLIAAVLAVGSACSGGGPGGASSGATGRGPEATASSAKRAPKAGGSLAPCLITKPRTNEHPPAALRDTFQAGQLWFGREGLWIGLWFTANNGVIHRNGVTRARDGYYLKFPTATLDGGRATSRYGPPRVRAGRVGGPVTLVGGVGGYGHIANPHLDFWPTVIRFPSRGCWRVATYWRGTSVRFVLKVP